MTRPTPICPRTIGPSYNHAEVPDTEAFYDPTPRPCLGGACAAWVRTLERDGADLRRGICGLLYPSQHIDPWPDPAAVAEPVVEPAGEPNRHRAWMDKHDACHEVARAWRAEWERRVNDDDVDPFDISEACEGCCRPAVISDCEGVPLCAACADGLAREATPEPASEPTPHGDCRTCGWDRLHNDYHRCHNADRGAWVSVGVMVLTNGLCIRLPGAPPCPGWKPKEPR